MDNKTIVSYLKNILEAKENSLKPMDGRFRIPKRINEEIKELKIMIDHLSK
jgi:hypothetical protein